MSFELPAEAIGWRKKVRAFVDSELQPLEMKAEMNEGRIQKTCGCAMRNLPLMRASR